MEIYASVNIPEIQDQRLLIFIYSNAFRFLFFEYI